MIFFLFLSSLFFITHATTPVLAQGSDSIAAVVNDEVITYTDLYDRIDMVIKSSGMPNNQKFKAKLLPQVLTGLITEEIQMQEAERLGLSVSDDEIEKGFEGLASQNQMSAKDFEKILSRQNIQRHTVDTQIKSQLAWGKVVQREIRPRVSLSDGEIQNELERLKQKEGETEYFVAEIFLPTGEGIDESNVRKAANDLSKQLKSDIRKFPAAARQFSQSSTAANGGIIGWVTPDQLQDELGQKLPLMELKQISQPIKDDEGYTILFLRDKRIIEMGTAKSEEKLKIKMAIFEKPASDQDQKTFDETVNIFRDDVKGCLDILKRTSKLKNAKLNEIDDVQSNIPESILNSVSQSNIGEVGSIIDNDNEVIVPMLCGRDGGASSAAMERQIENKMGTQRMDVLQKRYLRDLISDSYIERRV